MMNGQCFENPFVTKILSQYGFCSYQQTTYPMRSPQQNLFPLNSQTQYQMPYQPQSYQAQHQYYPNSSQNFNGFALMNFMMGFMKTFMFSSMSAIQYTNNNTNQSLPVNEETENQEETSPEQGENKIKEAFQDFLQDLVGVDPEETDEKIESNKSDIKENADKNTEQDEKLSDNSEAIANNTTAIETNTNVNNTQQELIEENSITNQTQDEIIQGNIKAIADNTTAIEKNVQSIKENKQSTEENKVAIEDNLSAVKDNKTAIEENIKTIQKNGDINNEQQALLESYAQIIAGLQAEIEELKAQQDINTEAIANNDAKDTAQDEKINKNTEAITNNDAKDAQQDQAIDTNATQTNTNAKQINTNTKEIESAKEAANANTEAIFENQINDEAQYILIKTNLELNAAQSDQINDINKKDKEQDKIIDKLETPSFQADGGYGRIDWNQDGEFGNDYVAGNKDKNWHENFLAVHGDTDKFFRHFGEYFKIPNILKIVEQDNSQIDKDSRKDFISDGKVTAHKISDSEIGFNITEKDSSEAAPFYYDYVIWSKENNTYKIGEDKNGDGLLTGNELKGIIENVGTKSKTSSPLILDINGDGKVSAQQGIGVDLDNNGTSDGAAVNGDKMLAMGDLNGNGKIDGAEVFGTETINPFTGERLNEKNGFEALKTIAINAETKTGIEIINESGAVDVQKLQQALTSQGINLGLISGDNVTALEKLGNVSKLSTNYEDKSGDAEYMNTHIESGAVSQQLGTYETSEGQTLKLHDVWFDID